MGLEANLSGVFTGGAAVTPHDTNLLARPAKSLYIGGTGAVKVTTQDGTDLTFAAVAVGFFPVRCIRVFSTGTTATNIIAVY